MSSSAWVIDPKRLSFRLYVAPDSTLVARGHLSLSDLVAAVVSLLEAHPGTSVVYQLSREDQIKSVEVMADLVAGELWCRETCERR